MNMTSRERLRRCYCHEELDRPGVYSRTGFPKNDPSYDRLKAYLQQHADLKQTWRGRAFESPDPVTTRIEPHSDASEKGSRGGVDGGECRWHCRGIIEEAGTDVDLKDQFTEDL